MMANHQQHDGHAKERLILVDIGCWFTMVDDFGCGQQLMVKNC